MQESQAVSIYHLYAASQNMKCRLTGEISSRARAGALHRAKHESSPMRGLTTAMRSCINHELLGYCDTQRLPCVKEADGGIVFKADFGTAQNHGATARIERQTALQGRITRAVLQAEPETAEAVGCRPLWGIPRKVHKRWKNGGLSGRGYF